MQACSLGLLLCENKDRETKKGIRHRVNSFFTFPKGIEPLTAP